MIENYDLNTLSKYVSKELDIRIWNQHPYRPGSEKRSYFYLRQSFITVVVPNVVKKCNEL